MNLPFAFILTSLEAEFRRPKRENAKVGVSRVSYGFVLQFFCP